MKIGIIGAGNVGAATAFSLIMQGIARKVILIDTHEQRAQAEADDIAHAAPFSYAGKIRAGNYVDLQGARVVIVTAGANQKPDEPRTALLERNVRIFENIIPQITRYAPDCIMLIAANPVDIMTSVALRLSGFPHNRVFGSGTVLDSARFRTLLGYHLNVSAKSVHANVLGEHGDSEVLIWSNAVAGGVNVADLANSINKPLTDSIKHDIDNKVRNAAYHIIAGKGATAYGIAGALSRICQAITSNEHAILNVSAFHQSLEGSSNICMSYPCIIGKYGIIGKLCPTFTTREHQDLASSATKIQQYTQQAFSYISPK
ncbi:MAG: L-lactate dehydrogenase [Alphaproteobacteria bacterium]|nr:L-lactate dehydrogenase [Alphaproteobacteria bacterium]